MQRLTQSPNDPEFVQNPYDFYDRARASGDLFFWADYGLPMAVSHAAVSALLRDRRLGRQAPPGRATAPPEHLRHFYSVEAHSMLELEPPRHTRLRRLVLRAFTSRNIAALAPTIRALCNDLIDALPAGPVDLLARYAALVPVITIARLLGVPERDADRLLDWSHAMVGMYQAGISRADEDAAEAAALAFADYVKRQIDLRRDALRDDLLSELIRAEQAGDKLTPDELVTTVILLLNAGHEATVHTLGNGIATCLARGVVPNAASAPAVVEEVLRFDPPLHMFRRWVYDDCTLFGHDFRRGDEVGLLLAAAGRDPGIWRDPHRFDPSRNQGPGNLAFGAGLHFCVGAPLARLELEIALEILFARLPGLTLSAPPRYGDIYHFHGLDALWCHPG